MKILVAEDDRAFSEILSARLRQTGYEPVLAFDTMQAIMVAMRTDIAAIILDLNMPGGHGFDALRQLKASIRTHQLPIIVLSNAKGDLDKKKAKELGAFGVFEKPPDLAMLMQAIDLAVGLTLKKPPAGNKAALQKIPDGTPTVVGKTILIADDDRILVKIVSARLKQLGYATLVAYDVPEALKIVATRTVNAVILDLDMPSAHGTEVIQQLKSFNRTLGIPIIVLSGSTNVDEARSALAHGANDYLGKPANIAQLEESLGYQLSKGA